MMFKKLFILLAVIPSIVEGQIITTICGNGIGAYAGDGGQASNAELNYPSGVVIDALGNLFIADEENNLIRKVSSNGIISTIAGNGTNGYSGDGGQATSAELYYPSSLIFDAIGNLYISDLHNNCIRKINTLGIISTVAGTGTNGYSGDGGQATLAKLNYPSGVAFDASGNLFIADEGNNVIRIVRSTGIISTIAGNGTQAFSGDGGQATLAALYQPWGVAFDATGNLYIADYGNQRVRKVNSLGIIKTVAGNGGYGYTGDGGQATASSLYYPSGVLIDATGNLYFADNYDQRIRKVNSLGIISTIAGKGTPGYSGDGGQTTNANLNYPNQLTYDMFGNFYISDTKNNRIRKITPPLIVSVNSATICAGTTTTLTAGGANTYSWSPSTGLSSITGSIVVANPTVTTSYTVTGTKGDSMGNTISIVTVPAITVNNPNICIGSTTTLTASGASTYSWNTGATVSTITVSPVVTTNYTISGTAGTCSLSNTATITVNSFPTITVNTATICEGAIATLTASGASTYTWNTGATTAIISLTPTITTSYTITGANGTCTSVATTTVTVLSNPTVTVNSPTISVGGTATLTASGATTYTWNTGATGNTITPSPTLTTNYAVTGTVGSCTETAIATVNVLNPNLVTKTYTCTGTTQTFTVPGCVNSISIEAWGAGGGGGGWDTYGGGTGGGGAYSSSTLSVTPGQVLTVVVGCAGIQGGACQSGSGGRIGGFGIGNGGNGGNSGTSGCSGPGGSGGGGTGIQNGSTILLVAAGGGGGGGGGNYSAGGIAGGGNENGLAGISAAPGLIGASGSTIGLNGANDIGDGGGGGGGGGGLKGGGGGQIAGGGSFASQDNGGGGGAGGTSLGSIIGNGSGQTPGNSGSPYLCDSCANGGNPLMSGGTAINGGSGLLIINYVPQSTISGTITSTSNCGITSATVSVSGGTTPYTYSWSPTGGTVAVANNLMSGNYSVTITDVNTCNTTETFSIAPSVILHQTLTATSPICFGNTTTFKDSVTGGSPPYSINWSSGGNVVGALVTIYVSPTITTQYYAAVQDANGCKDTVYKTVVVNLLPTIICSATPDTILAGSTSQLNSSGGAYTYTWIPAASLNAVNIPNPVALPLIPTCYSVAVTDANGCENLCSICLDVNNNTTGIKQVIGSNEQVSVYPNPNNGSFVIKLNTNTKYTMLAYDVNGKMVLSQIINGKTTIDASSLNEGVYNISLISNDGVINKRLVIVR